MRRGRDILILVIMFGVMFWLNGAGFVAAQGPTDQSTAQPTEEMTAPMINQQTPQPSAQPIPEPSEDAAVLTANLTGLPVQVDHQGNDPAGMRLALHLKEIFQKSALFRLADADERHISLRLTTRSQFAERPYLGSVYAVVWRYVESREVLAYYLGDRLGFADADVVAQEAEVLAAETDRVAGRYGYLLE